MPMKLNFGKTDIRINVSFAAAVTLSLILDGSGVCAVALLCCIIHEAGHIICLLALGEKPKKIELSFYGIKLERTELPCIKTADEIAVYVSGPAINIILAALFFLLSGIWQGMKTAAVISFLVGAFNMIPCRPLDGGNVMFTFIECFLNEEKAEKICKTVSVAVLLPLITAGIVMLARNGNITLVAVGAYLAAITFMNKKEKENIKI